MSLGASCACAVGCGKLCGHELEGSGCECCLLSAAIAVHSWAILGSENVLGASRRRGVKGRRTEAQGRRVQSRSSLTCHLCYNVSYTSSHLISLHGCRQARHDHISTSSQGQSETLTDHTLTRLALTRVTSHAGRPTQRGSASPPAHARHPVSCTASCTVHHSSRSCKPITASATADGRCTPLAARPQAC